MDFEADFDFNFDVLDYIGDEIEQAAARALRKAGAKVQGDAKRLAAYDTGRLAGSITSDYSYDAANEEHVVTIGTDLFYAPYVEFGTGQRGAQTNTAPPGYAVSFTKDIKGAPARPFLYPALKQNEGYVKEQVNAAAKKAVKS